MTKLTMILTVNGVIIGQDLGIVVSVIAMIFVSFAPDSRNFVTVVFLNEWFVNRFSVLFSQVFLTIEAINLSIEFTPRGTLLNRTSSSCHFSPSFNILGIKYRGPSSCKLLGHLNMSFIIAATGQQGPPIGKSFWDVGLIFFFKPPCLVLVGPSTHSTICTSPSVFRTTLRSSSLI